MKLLLMADGFVGKEITDWLINNYANDIALLVSTDKNEIYELGKSNGIDCLIFNSCKQIVDYLESFSIKPELGFLVWWPKLIKEPLLSFPVNGFLNTHPSLLPYNRGKHYNFWALVENAPFGVSLHFVDEGVDTGDIVIQKQIDCDWTDTGATLYQKAIKEMIELFKKSYPTIRNCRIPRYPQKIGGTFHLSNELEQASKIILDKNYTARDLLNLLRARTFEGYPACWFVEDNKKYEVRIEIIRKEK